MSRLGQLEAALDPLDPSVQAIQPPVHAEQPLLDAQDLAPEVELPLLDPGHPPLQVTDVLAHALQPAVEAAEVLQDQAFGFVCHSITITRLVTVAAMAGRGAFYRSATIPPPASRSEDRRV